MAPHCTVLSGRALPGRPCWLRLTRAGAPGRSTGAAACDRRTAYPRLSADGRSRYLDVKIHRTPPGVPTPQRAGRAGGRLPRGSGTVEHDDALDVVRHREEVERPQPSEREPVRSEVRDVPREGRGVAGDVDDTAGAGRRDPLDHLPARTHPRRVEDDD